MVEEGESVHIGRVLKDWLRQSGLLKRSALVELEEAWRAAAGPAIASQTRLVGVRREELWVEVGSAPLRAELDGFRKQELLGKLREHYTRRHIAGIRFLVSGNVAGLSGSSASGE